MKVLVVSGRGLRPAFLGGYGNLWIDTPALNGLAAGGVVFDWHFANRADAAGARRAWRSGRLHLPVPDKMTEDRPGPDLIAGLRERGIATSLVLDESRPGWPGFETDPAFAADWDVVDRIGTEGEGTPLERALEAALATLERLQDQDDFLVWLDLATPLPPWDVPEEFLEPYFHAEEGEEKDESEPEGEEDLEKELTPLCDVAAGLIEPQDDGLFLSLQSSYAAAVSYMDAGLGQLLEALAELPGGRDVAVIITADCGLPLGEHGALGLVRPEPFEELIHLPLIARLPGVASRRVRALTQAADLAPTLAGLFGLTLEGAQGQNLLPLLRGEADGLHEYVCAGIRLGDDVSWCLRTPGWAFLLSADAGATVPRLYVKVDDRWEVNDVVQHHLEWAEDLERTLRAYVTASCQPGPLVPPILPQAETPAAS